MKARITDDTEVTLDPRDAEIAMNLRADFNTRFGLNPWPASEVVPPDVYDAIDRYMEWWVKTNDNPAYRERGVLVGPHFGIMFKNVELIRGT